MAQIARKRGTNLGVRSVSATLQEPPEAIEAQHLIGEILVDEKFLLAALDVLAVHPDVQLTNSLLQVVLEQDAGAALFTVTKAIEREINSAVKKMAATMAAVPRTSIVSALAPFLMRESSSSVFVIVEFFRTVGATYLQSVLQDLIVAVESQCKIIQSFGPIEGDKDERKAIDSAEKILPLVSQLVSSLIRFSPSKVPDSIRYILKFFHSQLVLKISETCPVSPEESACLAHLVTTNTLGLRFLGLGLVCPALFSLPDPRTEFSQNSLITLSDILVALMGLAAFKNDPHSIPAHHHSSHAADLSAECEQFFSVVHRQKHLRDAMEQPTAQLIHWMSQLLDFDQLASPTPPFEFFALETYGNVLGNWICEHALDFITLCPDVMEHRLLHEFLLANKTNILQQAEEGFIRPQRIIGPGKWSPIQYGKCWNHEVKLPRSRKEELLVSIPQGLDIDLPAPNESVIDWTMNLASQYSFLLLIFCASTNKISTATQKYLRAWKKSFAEITERDGMILAVSPASHQDSNYINRKFAPNFPLIFDHHEHLAAHLHVAGYSPNAPLITPDDISILVVDSDFNPVSAWEHNSPSDAPAQKIVLALIIQWIRDNKNKKPSFKPTGSITNPNLRRSSRRSSDSQDDTPSELSSTASDAAVSPR